MKTLKIVATVMALASLGFGSTAYAAGGGNACAGDMEKYCSDVQQGGGRVLKCLKEHQSDLSPECSQMMSAMMEKMMKAKAAGGGMGGGMGGE
jgi:hypothetical protein